MSGPDGRPSAEPDYAPPVDPWAVAEREHRAALEAERQAALLEAADRRTAEQATAEQTAPTRAAPDQTMLDNTALIATHVVGDRTYLAGAPNDGPLVVAAVRTTTGDEIWRSDVAGTVGQWERIFGLPGEDAVAAFGRPDSSDAALRLVVLGGDDGALQWERPLGAEDEVLFVGDTVIVAEKDTAQVVGLDLHDHGKVRWAKINPKDTSGGTATAVVSATTVDDLAGPADGGGTAFAPDLGDDTRFVQIGADRSAQVFDAASGERVTQRANVAEPDDIVLAHDGKLFVAVAQNGYQVLRYDLAKDDGFVLRRFAD